MPATGPTSPFLCIRNQIEQTLDVLSPAYDRERHLRLKIEQAIQLGHQSAYAVQRTSGHRVGVRLSRSYVLIQPRER